METRVSELMRVDELISSLMARLRQANKVKRDLCREIDNDIAITITCHLDLEAAISIKKSKRYWNPERFLVRSEEPEYADRVRENRRMKRMALRSHLKCTRSPPSWMPILRSSPGFCNYVLSFEAHREAAYALDRAKADREHLAFMLRVATRVSTSTVAELEYLLEVRQIEEWKRGGRHIRIPLGVGVGVATEIFELAIRNGLKVHRC